MRCSPWIWSVLLLGPFSLHSFVNNVSNGIKTQYPVLFLDNVGRFYYYINFLQVDLPEHE